MTEQDSRRWDNDERRRGIGDARATLPSIEELAELAKLLRSWSSPMAF